MKENDGWTREMYPPKEKGMYLVKTDYMEYFVFHFDGESWGDQYRVIAWREIPTTEINTPF